MNRFLVIRRAALVAVVGMLSSRAIADGVSVNVRIGEPPPVVVVREREPVYETYVVGYRRDLYDADLRLRIARADEWRAHEELAAARRNEGEIAVALDEREATIAALRRRVGNGAANISELRAQVAHAAELSADLRKRLDAFDHRVEAAKEDYDAAKTLGDRDGMADAAERIKSNEAKGGAAALELRDNDSRLARLREEEAASASYAADRERLAEAEARAGALQHDLNIAHDAVFNTQARLQAATDAVYVAVRDRDEAMWQLHRDEILAGRYDPAVCGFNIDLSVWGGRMPRDPEVVHAYLVRDVGYWRSNPVLIEDRVVFVDRCPEVGHIRTFQRTREPERITVVEKIEVTVKVEDRRRVAETVVVERQRYQAETVERKTAVAEHRAPKPVYIEKPTVVNNTTIINNNTGASQREVTGLQRQVTTANKTAAEAKAAEAADAARIKKDEATIAAQQKTLAADHRDLKAVEAANAKPAEKPGTVKPATVTPAPATPATVKPAAATPGTATPGATEPRRGADTKADTTADVAARRGRGTSTATPTPTPPAPTPPAEDPAATRRSRGAATTPPTPPPAPVEDPAATRRSRGPAAPATPPPAPVEDPAATRRTRGAAPATPPPPAPVPDPAARRGRGATPVSPTDDPNAPKPK